MTTDLRNLSFEELKSIKRDNQQKLKKEYSQYKKKQKLIDDIKKIQKVKEKPNQNPNLLISKHLKSIFRIVSRIKQFPQILPLIFAKLLNELLKNMTKEL